MRPVAFVLTLAFGGLQTVAVTDCCCPAACARPVKQSATCHDCEGVGKEAPVKPAPKPTDCCEKEAPVQEKTDEAKCVHIQPSQDVASHAHDAVVSPHTALVLPAADVNPTPPLTARSLEGRGEFHRPERGRPLFLLDSAFLI